MVTSTAALQTTHNNHVPTMFESHMEMVRQDPLTIKVNKLEYVKVKIKSLSDEARSIRKQEHKQKKSYRDILLRDRLRRDGAIPGNSCGKWTIDKVTNNVVTLTQTIQTSYKDGNQAVFHVTKNINLNWVPTQEDFARAFETWRGLQEHRRLTVRNEARATYLAYAYIQGIPYNVVENSSTLQIRLTNVGYCSNNHAFDSIVLPRIIAIVSKYGKGAVDKSTIMKWINGE